MPKPQLFSARRLPTPGECAFGFMSIFCLACILRNSEVAIAGMTRGLKLCVSTVIPSLFPFMVLSELIVSSGAVVPVGKLLSRPFRWLFGIRGEGSVAVLLGALCGFPVGAKSAVSLYHSGRLDRRELSHLLTFCNNPSSAFLISAVGTSLFGCHAFGILLYAVTLISALLCGIVSGLFFRHSVQKTGANRAPKETCPPPVREKERHGVESFTTAVSDSAVAMLSVCAFVVFFSVLTQTLTLILSGAHLSPTLSALLCGIAEMTGGVSMSAALPTRTGIFLCAGLVGWSGISVHCQIMSICRGCGISFFPYAVAKFAQGLLNVLLLKLTLLLFRPNLIFDGAGVSDTWETAPSAFSWLAAVLFLLTLVLLLLRKKRPHRA